MKLKKILVFGLIFTTPIAVFANDKQNANIDSRIERIERKLNANELNYLHKEGAISTRDANKYLRDKLEKTNLETVPNIKNSLKNKNIKTKIIDNTIKIDFFESKDQIRLRTKRITYVNNSEITKTENGWQVIIELSKPYNINFSSIPKTSKYISDIKISNYGDYIYIFNIIENQNYKINKPLIKTEDNIDLSLNFKAKKLNKKSWLGFPFFGNFNANYISSNNTIKAVPPPIGDIAEGSVVLQNRGFIQLEGPRISLNLNNASPTDALIRLSKLGAYGVVIVNDETKNRSQQNSDSEPRDIGEKVTLSFVNEDYSVAFNSILLASGLQAKKSENLIIVGSNVLGKSFGPQVSKVYRLNQTSAASAADYLASLGASISKVDTIDSSSSSQNGTGSNSNSSPFKFIDSYSSSSGPLRGLIGTTDSRLQSITLVGSSELIQIAEKYLKQLDLRQRQVALSVKILDVELTNTDSLSNDMAFRTGSTFIVNEKGKLFSAFGSFIPPALSSGSPSESRESTQESTIKDGVITNEQTLKNSLSSAVTPNPGWQYTANQLYSFLIAQITSSSTKVLANPTLILSENSEKIEGGAEVIGDISSGEATIGRPYANESFVTLGTNVITDYKTSTSDEGGITTCEAEFSTAGLTFGARVKKIDDNGYVTFSLSPKLTSVSEIINIPNCGPINILSVRRLDTGTLRVKDSQTLILTGVISNLDGNVVTKTPILGDIPILGRMFRSTGGNERKSELIILVTPKIINDTESNTFGLGYEPVIKEAKNLLDNTK